MFYEGIPFLNLEQEAVYAEELKAGGRQKDAEKSRPETASVDPNSYVCCAVWEAPGEPLSPLAQSTG